MKSNHCIICGADMGNSTIHLKLPKGKEIGPICSTCRDKLTDDYTPILMQENINYNLEYIDADTVKFIRA